MLTHGVPLSGLLLSTIVPIPKNKRDNLSAPRTMILFKSIIIERKNMKPI